MKLYCILLMLIFINPAHSMRRISPKEGVETCMNVLDRGINDNSLQKLLVKPLDNTSWERIQTMSQQDNINAQVFIALCFIKGYYVKKDKVKGFSLLEEIASQKNSEEIQYILGYLSFYDIKGHVYNEKRHIAGLKLLEQLANKGYIKAQEFFVFIYYGHRRYNNPEKFLYWAQIAAKQDSIYSIRKLAEAYAKGKVVLKDIKKAIYWGEKAIKVTNSYEEMETLALTYWLYGNGNDDDEKSQYWYRKAEQEKSKFYKNK